MDFRARYKQLNTAQRQAVDTIDGPVMVIAGPGTGKTELLSMRAANILLATDTLPDTILCLTFTDSGAAAMRERLVQIIGPTAYKIAIHTFHSFGSEIINQNGAFFYQGAAFRPADSLSSYQLLRGIFDELDYDNPLASKLNDEYTHLSDTLTVISELKKSGLTSDELLMVLDANDQVLDAVEPLLAEAFANRISKNTPKQLYDLIDTIRGTGGAVALPGITPLSKVLADSLTSALTAADAAGSTKPITAWRAAWTKKDSAGKLILKSRERSAKLRACSYIYYQYLAHMQQAELYDFDDMILRVVHAMEVFPDLRFNLQEKYQYIMVDEFQDTNLAQMRILFNLTANEASNERPNIMVVGDDDQAIYSFQGADVGNIRSFLDLYDHTEVITLTDNYRSGQPILDYARSVITQGADRLETHLGTVDKTLTARRDATASSVTLAELPSTSSEHAWLARTIAGLIKSGTPAASIAVLARRHSEIEALLPFFAKEGVPVNYERSDNILELDIIALLECLAAVVVHLADQEYAEADGLLPKLLSHPAFGIAPIDLWRLSLRATTNRHMWIETMATMPEFVPLHTWLITLAQASFHMPLERILDKMIGTPLNASGVQAASSKIAPSETTSATSVPPGPLSTPPNDAIRQDTSTTQVEQRVTSGRAAPKNVLSPLGRIKILGADRMAGPASAEGYTSPIYTYYFSPKNLAATPDTYLTTLQALTSLRTKLTQYQPATTPTLASLLEFLQLARQVGAPLSIQRPYIEHTGGAITLMTAHRSKGLEFDHVFITGAIDSRWGERVRVRSRLINYPENLPLAPAGDTFDERLRLFFVAMTRAKVHLTISYATSDDAGKPILRASFLSIDDWQVTTPQIPAHIQILTQTAQTIWYQPVITPLTPPMHDLLRPILQHYKLSSTHLNTFLDISLGGPQYFLIHCLLKFPQAIHPSAGYGLAIHAVLQRAHAHLSATGKHRPLEDLLHDFEHSLRDQYLAPDDFKKYLQKGTDVLSAFLTAKYSQFTPGQKSELNFANQNVFVGQAHLTGSLDLLDIKGTEVVVTDYKTGRAVRGWIGRTDYEKIKLHKYKQQLMFYHLLLTHSRDYSKYNVASGVIEFVEPTPQGELLILQASFSAQDLATFARLVQIVWQCIITLNLPDSSSYEPTYKGMLAFEADLLDSSI